MRAAPWGAVSDAAGIFLPSDSYPVGSGIAENRKSKEANGGKSWKSIEGIL
jgi:hypothetical protein